MVIKIVVVGNTNKIGLKPQRIKPTAEIILMVLPIRKTKKKVIR